MKHIVTSGCSFSEDTHTWSTFVRLYSEEYHPSEKIKVWNYGCGSRGNFWIRRSISNKVFDLLQEGVNPSDIYAIASWSTSSRIETPFDHTKWPIDPDMGNFDPSDETKPGRGLERFGEVRYHRYLVSDFASKFHDGSSYDGGETFWTCCHPTVYKTHEEEMLKFNQHKYASSLEIINYYDQILFLQNYLDVNKVNYMFMSMRNLRQNIFGDDSLSNEDWWCKQFKWNEDSKFEINNCKCSHCEDYRRNGHWLKPQYSRMITPNVKECPMIEESLPHLKPTIKQINWDKFWFYKNERNDYGGNLEWTHENTDFCSPNPEPHHPMPHSWLEFFWNILKPRLEKDKVYVKGDDSFYVDLTTKWGEFKGDNI